MTDHEIDELLKKAARTPQEVDPAVLERIAKPIGRSLRPVRPLASTGVLTAGLVAICAAVALVGALRAGFYGFDKMALWERAAIFSTLGILVSIAAMEFVSEMIPGARHWVSASVIPGMSSGALLAVFALIFRDYQTDHFFSAGIVCLLIGVGHAIPASLLSWLILRRGFAVNPASAGLVAGTLGGLAGVAMLELHCPNFEATHILVWHTAVVPFSAAMGAAVARLLHFRVGSVHP